MNMMSASQWLTNNSYKLNTYQESRFFTIAASLYTVEFKRQPHTMRDVLGSGASTLNVYDINNQIVVKCLNTAYQTAKQLNKPANSWNKSKSTN
jgi:hypothetical protein